MNFDKFVTFMLFGSIAIALIVWSIVQEAIR